MAEEEIYTDTTYWHKDSEDGPVVEVWDAENNKEGEYYNEYFMLRFREERDQLLKDSDWTSFNDSPLSDEKKAEWATYRQALRDLGATVTPKHAPADSETGGVSNVTWPTKPE